MFSSLVPIPVMALLKYFKIIGKVNNNVLQRETEEEESMLKNKSKKNHERKSKNVFEMGPMHRPLQAIESNTLSNGSNGTEHSEEIFKL